DPDFIETVEDIQLCEGEAVDTAGTDGLPHQHRVEPAAAAWPPGHDTELAAPLAQRTADLVLELGRERPLPDPGRVGLADAEHVADRRRPKPRAGRRL